MLKLMRDLLLLIFKLMRKKIQTKTEISITEGDGTVKEDKNNGNSTIIENNNSTCFDLLMRKI